MDRSAQLYTDGSCNTQRRHGAWVAIILTGEEKLILSGKATETTHNRMELIAVIKGIEYIINHYPIKAITIVSDSQYVIGLCARKEKLSAANFTTKKGDSIQNADLVKELFSYEDNLSLEFLKIKAHQKKNETVNYNIEADKLARKIVREMVVKAI